MRILLFWSLLLSSTPSFSASEPIVVDLQSPALRGYQPSTITWQEALSLKDVARKRGLSFNSQCYNRAQVWAWQVKAKRDINTMKVFIFYSRAMMVDDHDWWFHVTPVVQVAGMNQPMMLDYFYSDIPRGLPKCKVITRYSEYEQADPGISQCFMMFTSPYYFHPDELEALEKGESSPREFDVHAVRRSMRQAFLPPWNL